MEEALWSFEDKWKLSTQKAIAIFASTSLLAMSMCIVGVLLKRMKSRRKGLVGVHQESFEEGVSTVGIRPACKGWNTVKKALAGSMCWSGPRKWEEGLRASQREAPTPLLVGKEIVGGLDVGWQSHNSCSAVWQKPILMGEKCELPRFSGLILYDQKGAPLLHQCREDGSAMEKQEIQEKKANVVRTTLRDLL